MKALDRIPAKAVGIGIMAALLAAQAKPSTIHLLAAAERDGETPEAWVHFCMTAALEARDAVMDDPPLQPVTIDDMRMDFSPAAASWCNENPDWQIGPDGNPRPGWEAIPGRFKSVQRKGLETSAHTAAAFAFRACMPKLTGRRATQSYIACVASALQHSYIGGGEAKALLYTAQLALSAWPSRRKGKG